MSLLSLAHLLLYRPMQKRFESDPLFQATMLLLHERIPRRQRSMRAPPSSPSTIRFQRSEDAHSRLHKPRHAEPGSAVALERQVHMMITCAGRRLQPLEGPRRHPLARRLHLRQTGHILLHPRRDQRGVLVNRISAHAQRSKHFEAIFSEGRAEFRCRDHDYDTHTRSLFRPKMTSNCAESGNHQPRANAAERSMLPAMRSSSGTACRGRTASAFSNLFVQTEIIRWQGAILCTRRPRFQGERAPWMLHLMVVHGAEIGEVSYETDRMQFIGRGNTVADPQAMSGVLVLSPGRSRTARALCSIRLSPSATDNAGA